ncbi:MAG: excinuclease ABC subunit UvrC [Deltaproteobacteria bacterium]|nr:MAG: excinuclease ABC subunit UvrC [Deltaproteobacteria bacterium]
MAASIIKQLELQFGHEAAHVVATMNSNLQDKLDNLPSASGVYIMKDGNGEILYVGKGKDLRKRVFSYFRNQEHVSPKTRVLVGKVADMEVILTGTEKEALILESNLIKLHRPRYNVVLRDDKRYLVLRLDPKSEYPGLSLVRRIRNDGALYFGPYSSAQAVRRTLKVLYQMFPLRQCSGPKFKTRQRPCLNHQMGRCLGLCVGTVSAEDYAQVVEQAVLFLKGRTKDLQNKLRDEMQRAAESLQYEKAALYRDRLHAVERTLEKQLVTSPHFRDQDVIATRQREDDLALAVLFIRGGRMVGSRVFAFGIPQGGSSEVVGAFIQQYYAQQQALPEEILIAEPMVDRALLSDWLTDLKGKRVTVRLAQRGDARRLLVMAENNAANYLLSEMARQEDNLAALERLGEKVGMETIPRRLECVDISNVRGQFPVGSLVAFLDGEPDKSAYRRYRIENVKGSDDTAMMAEVLKRRFTDERDSQFLPDLLVVDGGRGQLNRALSVLAELDLSAQVPVAGLAKTPRRDSQSGPNPGDRLYLTGQNRPLLLKEDPPLHFLLARLRDEAHRFAIRYYQKRHRRGSLRSRLDKVCGIGPKRRRDLIRHFGSVRSLVAASVEELTQVRGISWKLAERIHVALRGDEKGGRASSN